MGKGTDTDNNDVVVNVYDGDHVMALPQGTPPSLSGCFMTNETSKTLKLANNSQSAGAQEASFYAVRGKEAVTSEVTPGGLLFV